MQTQNKEFDRIVPPEPPEAMAANPINQKITKRVAASQVLDQIHQRKRYALMAIIASIIVWAVSAYNALAGFATAALACIMFMQLYARSDQGQKYLELNYSLGKSKATSRPPL